MIQDWSCNPVWQGSTSMAVRKSSTISTTLPWPHWLSVAPWPHEYWHGHALGYCWTHLQHKEDKKSINNGHSHVTVRNLTFRRKSVCKSMLVGVASLTLLWKFCCSFLPGNYLCHQLLHSLLHLLVKKTWGDIHISMFRVTRTRIILNSGAGDRYRQFTLTFWPAPK